KTSVSILRRRATEQLDDETTPFLSTLSPSEGERVGVRGSFRRPVSATHLGAIHHRFLQRVSLDRVGSIQQLKAEGQRLVQAAVLTSEEMDLLDWQALAGFWQAHIG